MKFIFSSLVAIALFSNLYSKEKIEKWKLDLVSSAQKAREMSYSPYSKYSVGAAIRTKGGKIYQGTNVENASYGLTICAERSCVFSAISSGEKNLDAIAIVVKDIGAPCGACRQVLNEFNPEMLVIMSNADASVIEEFKLSELLTRPFGPKNLE